MCASIVECRPDQMLMQHFALSSRMRGHWWITPGMSVARRFRNGCVACRLQTRFMPCNTWRGEKQTTSNGQPPNLLPQLRPSQVRPPSQSAAPDLGRVVCSCPRNEVGLSPLNLNVSRSRCCRRRYIMLSAGARSFGTIRTAFRPHSLSALDHQRWRPWLISR